MTSLHARVVSVHVGSAGELQKTETASIEATLDGIAGDRHRGPARACYAGDKQPKGTVRRNERQWSAVSTEELDAITAAMRLTMPLTAATVGANLCLTGVSHLSALPKGTLLTFPSGAVLSVEEYNPPCQDMGRKIAALHRSDDGKPLTATSFPKAAKILRGIVGVVDVPGTISAGDVVEIDVYEHPAWLQRPD